MAMPGDPRSFTAVPAKRDEDDEVVARPRKEERPTKERAGSMRKSLKLEEKMKAPVGSKRNKEKKKKKKKKEKMKKTEETPEVEQTKAWVEEGYDGPIFEEEVEMRYQVDPSSGKRKKLHVVRLTQGQLEYMAKLPPRQPRQQRPPMMDPRARVLEKWFIARDKAACESREDILKQYKDRGFAELIFKVDDDDE